MGLKSYGFRKNQIEIDNFIEVEFPKGRGYYIGNNIARLNSGRVGICPYFFNAHYSGLLELAKEENEIKIALNSC